MKSKLPQDSVRGRIRFFIEQHAHNLGDDVLEIGSRMHTPAAWWVNNRDLAQGTWTGIDIQSGDNVDRVVDMHAPPPEWERRFSGVLCSEVLEHVRRPQQMLDGVRFVMQPGACVIVTTLTAFPLHGFPDDYRRWSESGLRAELEDAGFDVITTASAGEVVFMLNDHNARQVRRVCPMHVFAVARA